jgi:hypothetical protein
MNVLTLIIAALTMTGPATPVGIDGKPDALQVCAAKALHGDFGRLKPWQTTGYRQALSTGATVQGTAWVTGYYPYECMRRDRKTGKRVLCNTRSGRKPTLRSAAVRYDAFNDHVFQFCWTGAYGLRVVEDSGANSNTRYARHKGADAWLDYYWQTRHDRNPVTPYAIFGDSKEGK